jgi:hypothetical protein
MQKDTKDQSGASNREAKTNQWQFVGVSWWWLVVVVYWWFGSEAHIKKTILSKHN